MSKAIVRRESRVVTYFDLAPEASPDDVLSFLRLASQKPVRSFASRLALTM
ncbi:hypothetical protein [Meiothermus ruber]|uniref:hypothetical protein n=1 Tax=Meiothermus ruber TaxID=277 RepID=UPI0003D5D9A5|nr:hypothetical protein [Meiothermus ruber]